jgi:dihydroxyacetone synthase
MHPAKDPPITNGTTNYGKKFVDELKREENLEHASIQKLSKEQDHVLKTFRLLIADLCQQFNGGHPGYIVFYDHRELLTMS